MTYDMTESGSRFEDWNNTRYRALMCVRDTMKMKGSDWSGICWKTKIRKFAHLHCSMTYWQRFSADYNHHQQQQQHTLSLHDMMHGKCQLFWLDTPSCSYRQMNAQDTISSVAKWRNVMMNLKTFTPFNSFQRRSAESASILSSSAMIDFFGGRIMFHFNGFQLRFVAMAKKHP